MQRNGEPILKVEHAERHLTDGQRRTEISLNDIALEAGKTYSLCGPSGVGKTTALEMLSMAQAPNEFGAITLNWKGSRIDLSQLVIDDDQEQLAAIRGRHFGYIVQTSRLFPYLTLRENVEISQVISDRPDHDYADQLMAIMEIRHLADVLPSKLSGGQRQRACVARALAHRPSVVLADEPTSSVDQEMGDLILTVIMDYIREHSATALVITHNRDLVRRFRLNELKMGSASADQTLKTVFSGTPKKRKNKMTKTKPRQKAGGATA